MADLPDFCDAIAGFAESLVDLSIDAWKDKDTSMHMPFEREYTRVHRSLVLDSISQLKKLKTLRVRDWANLASTDCQGGRALRCLQHLEVVHVGQSFPCTSCTDSMFCAHFDSSLPFKCIE